jgi:hypothetical protein
VEVKLCEFHISILTGGQVHNPGALPPGKTARCCMVPRDGLGTAVVKKLTAATVWSRTPFVETAPSRCTDISLGYCSCNEMRPTKLLVSGLNCSQVSALHNGSLGIQSAKNTYSIWNYADLERVTLYATVVTSECPFGAFDAHNTFYKPSSNESE